MSTLPEAELVTLEREGYRFGQEQAAITDRWYARVKMLGSSAPEALAASFAGYVRALAHAMNEPAEVIAASILAAGIGGPTPPQIAELVMERLRRRSEDPSSNPPPQSDPPS